MPNSFSVAFEGHFAHAISRPFRANRFIGCFPGLKPWAKFFSPSGASLRFKLRLSCLPFWGRGRPTTEGRIGALSIRGVKDPQPSAPVLAMFRERIAVASMRSFRAGYWQRLMAQLITWGVEN